MIKTFFKELIITVLLMAAVLLVLTVLFYDSIPVNKVIPEKVTYSMPTELVGELDSTVEEQQEIIVTYRITDDDINKYKDQNAYNAGKIDPFASAPTPTPIPTTTTKENLDDSNGSNNGETSGGNSTNGGSSSSSYNESASKGGLQK